MPDDMGTLATPPDDERRASELTRIKQRVATLEQNYDRTERMTSGMHYALFGLPEDKHSNGLVGEMHALRGEVQLARRAMQTANNKIMAVLLTTLTAVTADVLTRHLG